jgi:hypothetical protein
VKASKVASVVSALLASDAKPTEAQILAAILAADKKGKDEGGLGPVEIENKGKAKDKAKDAFPDKDDDKAKDEDKDDEKAKDGDMPDVDGEDEDKDDKAKDADVQPKESVSGAGAPAGNKGKESAKDKKGMDTATAVKHALDARDALHAARRDVETVLGVVAYDSAADVYKAALDKLGVDTAGVHASAYPALFKMKRDALAASAPTLASDASTVKSMAGAIKGYNRLS